MATLNWFQRLVVSFSALVRRRKNDLPGEEAEQGGLPGERRTFKSPAEGLIPVILSSFGKRAGDPPDVAPLAPRVLSDSDYQAMVELISLFGSAGFPYVPETLASWHELAIPPAILFALFDLVKPRTVQDLETLLQVLRPRGGRLDEAALGAVALVAQGLGRPIDPSNIVALLDVFSTPENRNRVNSYLSAIQCYEQVGPVDARADRLLLDRMNDEEALAATSALLDLLRVTVGRVETFDEIRDLLNVAADRVTVRRLAKAISLFEEYGVKTGMIDSFHLSFSTSQEDLDWLEGALKGLADLGRQVERISLMQLREWAPEPAALARYLMASRSFKGLGLKEDEIDRLVLKRVETEGSSQVLGLVGDLWFRLGFGELTYQKAEHIADLLTDRVLIKRFETAVTLLRETKMSPADIELLAEQFLAESDDVNWLEAVLASAGEFGDHLGRIQILRLREYCPEPAHLYRYFRLKRAFAWYGGDEHSALDEWLIGVAPAPDRTSVVLALAEILSRHDPHAIPLDEIKDLYQAYATMELVEALGVCLRTFNGDRNRFRLLIRQVAESSSPEYSISVLNRALEDSHLTGNNFERALELLVRQFSASSQPSRPSGPS